MANIYVDSSGGGSDTSPYDTWAKAADGLQKAIDIWNAGDTIYAKNGSQGTTESPNGIQIDLDQAGGAEASTWDNPIIIIGCDFDEDQEPPSGADFSRTGSDGRYVIDGGTGVAHQVLVNDGNQDYVWLINIECNNAGAAKNGYWASGTAEYTVMVNCRFNGNAQYGIYADSMVYGIYKQCIFSNNGSGVFRPQLDAMFWACRFDTNTTSGVILNGGSHFRDCVFDGNSNGINMASASVGWVQNSVFDANADGITGSPVWMFTLGCRFTNNTNESIDTSAGDEYLVDYLYSESAKDAGETIWEIPDRQNTAHATWGGADVNDGYVVGEFNLDPDEATYFSEEIVVPAS
jgi:hypothetical protein